jgi:hypothetical protein
MLPRWHVTWRGWRGQPIFQPEVAARAIVDAAFDSRNRKAWIGLPTWKAILANKFAPALLDRYLAKVGYSSQLMEDFDAIVRYAGCSEAFRVRDMMDRRLFLFHDWN